MESFWKLERKKKPALCSKETERDEQQKTGERVQGGWRSLFDTRNDVEGDLIL